MLNDPKSVNAYPEPNNARQLLTSTFCAQVARGRAHLDQSLGGISLTSFTQAKRSHDMHVYIIVMSLSCHGIASPFRESIDWPWRVRTCGHGHAQPAVLIKFPKTECNRSEICLISFNYFIGDWGTEKWVFAWVCAPNGIRPAGAIPVSGPFIEASLAGQVVHKII